MLKMATDPALVSPPRRLWQLPTFVLGLVAIWAAATYATPPDFSANAATRIDDLAAALERQPVDGEAVEGLVRAAAASTDQSPRSHFLLGSGYVKLAGFRPTESPDLWKLALQHFDACDARMLKPADAARLDFRAALAAASLDLGDPALLMTALVKSPVGDDCSECSRLLANCAMRLPTPDLKRARDELTNYLGITVKAVPVVMERCKLRVAELNTRLGEPAKARRWLADISGNAPADVQATAKTALAQFAVAEKNYTEAIALLEAALVLPAGDKGAVRFALGATHRKAGHPAQAIPYFEQASREAGELGARAALIIAEIRAAEPAGNGNRGDAVDWLERGSAALPPEVVTDADRRSFEKIIGELVKESDFISAARAVEAYQRIAMPHEDQPLRAEVNTAWAESLEKIDPAGARAKYAAAAKSHMTYAAMLTGDKAAVLQKAIACFKQAGDTAQALTTMDRLLKLEPASLSAAAKAALHVERANLLPSTDFAGIKASLEAAMNEPGPQALAAKLKLALLHISRAQELTAAAGSDAVKMEAVQIGEFGRSLLKQVADSATVPAESRGTHEQGLFELGRLSLKDAKYTDAEARFKKQLSLYPNGSTAGYGRLWLVCALLQQARGNDSSKKILEEALSHLAPLTQSTDAYLQTYGQIWTANTHLELGNIVEATNRSQQLMTKYQGKPEELVAGKLLFYAYLKQETPQPADASRTLDRMEAAFKALPATAYPHDPEYSHERWKSELPRLRQELIKFQK